MLLPTAKGLYVDVGTAAQTILLAALSLGLGAGIVTSFSRNAVGAILTVTAARADEVIQ
jgi:nitroreductase